MIGNSIHSLSNLAAGLEFELSVPVGQDVAALAKADLAERGLPESVQQGFYVSVFPTGLDDAEQGEPAGVGSQQVANPPSNSDSSPTGSPYDTQTTPGYDLEAGADPVTTS